MSRESLGARSNRVDRRSCQSRESGDTLGPMSQELMDAINAYRRTRKCDAIRTSPALIRVAEAHVKDLNAKGYPAIKAGGADAQHSWYSGEFSCEFDFKENPECAWEKPKQIAGYSGFGYEISYAFFPGDAWAQGALNSWIGSPAHHDIILSRGVWSEKRLQWKAMGAAIGGNFACAWFGTVVG